MVVGGGAGRQVAAGPTFRAAAGPTFRGGTLRTSVSLSTAAVAKKNFFRERERESWQ